MPAEVPQPSMQRVSSLSVARAKETSAEEGEVLVPLSFPLGDREWDYAIGEKPSRDAAAKKLRSHLYTGRIRSRGQDPDHARSSASSDEDEVSDSTEVKEPRPKRGKKMETAHEDADSSSIGSSSEAGERPRAKVTRSRPARTSRVQRDARAKSDKASRKKGIALRSNANGGHHSAEVSSSDGRADLEFISSSEGRPVSSFLSENEKKDDNMSDNSDPKPDSSGEADQMMGRQAAGSSGGREYTDGAVCRHVSEDESSSEVQMSQSDADHALESASEAEAHGGRGDGGGGQKHGDPSGALRDGEIADLRLYDEVEDVATFDLHPRAPFIAIGLLSGHVEIHEFGTDSDARHDFITSLPPPRPLQDGEVEEEGDSSSSVSESGSGNEGDPAAEADSCRTLAFSAGKKRQSEIQHENKKNEIQLRRGG